MKGGKENKKKESKRTLWAGVKKGKVGKVRRKEGRKGKKEEKKRKDGEKTKNE